MSSNTKTRQEVPFSDFESLLNQLRQACDHCSQNEAMKLLGYESSPIASWRDKNTAPTLALNAIKWVLHDLKVPNQQPMPKINLSFEEMTAVLSILVFGEVSSTVRRSLIKKLAAMIAAEPLE